MSNDDSVRDLFAIFYQLQNVNSNFKIIWFVYKVSIHITFQSLSLIQQIYHHITLGHMKKNDVQVFSKNIWSQFSEMTKRHIAVLFGTI